MSVETTPDFAAMATADLEMHLELAKSRLRDTGGSQGGGFDELSVYQIEVELQRRVVAASKVELEDARSHYARLYNAAPIGYVTLDAHGVIRDANSTAATLLGRNHDQLTGWPLLALAEPGSRDAMLEHLATCRRDGRAIDEVSVRTSRGFAWARLCSCIVGSAPDAPEILTAIIDISDRKQTERALRAARDELERRVRQRTAELERVNRKLIASAERGERLEVELRLRVDELARADRNKDEFLAMLAHELRNPLAPIQNAVEVLKLSGGKSDKEEWARTIIARQVVHLRRLVDDLLDLSRITLGKFRIASEPVELALVVERAVELAGALIESRRHRLVVRHMSGAVIVRGDRERLTQALANLLNNAAKYTADGGEIQVETSSDGVMAAIRIVDSGEGMEPELLQRAFDAFAQGDHSLARAEGGLGIGLTLVRRIVELHGGSVSAHSAGQGQGSTFEVRLPCDAASRLPARPASRSEAGAPRRKILVVDDNVDAVETLAEMLRLEGHEIRTAQDAENAVMEAVEFHPDVALLDIGLPGMDGYTLADRLRALPEMRNAVLVAVTGYGRSEDFARSAAVGFDHHLVKPIDPSRLAAVLVSEHR